jgi:putative ABC transport system permease protein
VTTFFYARLARKNIVNNRKIYLPYILTAIGMVMMFYIVGFLASDPEVSRIAGGEMLQALLSFGVGVIGVFAPIFLIYTNSFLMKLRKRNWGFSTFSAWASGTSPRSSCGRAATWPRSALPQGFSSASC